MADLNVKNDLIYNCAKGLFDISMTLKDISPEFSDLSDFILYCSDKTLSKAELPEEEIETPVQQQSFEEFCKDETCPDCGGLKDTPQQQEICPDCGGIKHEHCEENSKSQNPQSQSTQDILFDNADPGAMCHGHTGDGPSTPVQQQQQVKKTETPENIKSDVRGLIDEIRRGL
jgi:hypothetical protein